MTVVAATSLSAHTLLNVVSSALVAGIGITVAFSALIYCADRAAELHRARRAAAAWAMTASGVLALAACLGLVVYGLVLVLAKGK
ncbi:MAG TPA: hypothetical protein VME22_21500 [Solirubrobacteraceae bacterium]|nr:hypothetical protein [Solirubrobacteraceae bacterium]